MTGLAGGLKNSVGNIREWLVRELLRQQKPELDRKIDQMLRPPKLNRLMEKHLGLGKGIGKRLVRPGTGLGVGKRLFRRLL
jgi:hypothetical protein